MKKKAAIFLAGMLTTALLGSLALPALAALGQFTITVAPIQIQVDGRTFAPKNASGTAVPVFSYKGTTYAPLRALAEAYQLQVGYDSAANMATVSRPAGHVATASSCQQAAEQFTACVSQGDLSAALQLFAIAEETAHYDFTRNVSRFGVFQAQTMAGPGYGIYRPLNELFFANQAACALREFVYCLATDCTLDTSVPLPQKDSAPEALYNALSPAKLTGLTLVRLDYAAPAQQDGAPYQNSIRKLGAIYGFTSAKDYLALYQLDGTYYYGGFQFWRYGDSWKIGLLSSPIGGTSAQGRLTKTTLPAYLALL